jgi:hypothetical protein
LAAGAIHAVSAVQSLVCHRRAEVVDSVKAEKSEPSLTTVATVAPQACRSTSTAITTVAGSGDRGTITEECDPESVAAQATITTVAEHQSATATGTAIKGSGNPVATVAAITEQSGIPALAAGNAVTAVAPEDAARVAVGMLRSTVGTVANP